MRQHYVLLLPIILACGRSAPARVATDTTPVGQSGSSDEAARSELTRVEDEWEDAVKAHDAAFFQRTMSDDFIGTTNEGVSDKSTLVQVNADTSVSVDSFGRSEEKIRIYGNGTVGVITGVSPNAVTWASVSSGWSSGTPRSGLNAQEAGKLSPATTLRSKS